MGNVFLFFNTCFAWLNVYLSILKYKLMYPFTLKVSRGLSFRKGFFIIAIGKVKIGKGCFFNNNCSVNSLQQIEIDDDCIFGENVHIYDHNHIYKDMGDFRHMGYTTSPVHIGRHCWISSNCTILKGVSIGDNCVIGAGTVVYKDIPANSLVINKQILEIKEINRDI